MTLVAFDGLADVQRREFVSMAGLEPIMQGFGGKNATENLVNGMNASLASLKKYTSTLTFDPNRANEVFDRIEVWQQQNSEKLRDLMRKGAKTVPEQIAMTLGSDEAKSFIVASFSEAARGLKGWVGGAVAKNYKTNPAFTESMALDDRESRMITFASIVQLDQNGTLAKIFAGKSLGDGDGLGEPISIGIVLIVIAVAASICAISFLAYQAMDQRQKNKLIDRICELGSKEDCVQATKETLKELNSDGGGVVAAAATEVGKWVGIGLVAYVGATFLLPKLLKRGRE